MFGMVKAPALNPGDGHLAHLVTHLRAGRYLATVKSYRSGFHQGWHEHEPGDISMVLRGGGTGGAPGHEAHEGPGSIALCGPGTRHRWSTAGGGVTTLHLVFLPGERPRLAGVARAVREADVRRAMVSILQELASPDASSALHVESLAESAIEAASVGSLGARAASGRGAGPAWVGRAIEFLAATPHRPVGLDEVAAVAGVDRAHLARTFRARFGRTAGEVHRDLRLDHAARLLAGPGARIGAAARAAGFCDQAHLGRCFAARFGVTPGAYRGLLCRWS